MTLNNALYMLYCDGITHKLYEMAKPLKNGDAKLQGLMLFYNYVSQFPNTTRLIPSFMCIVGGVYVLKIFPKISYYLHRYLQGYNEILSNDALCEELKSKFRTKAIYHGHKANNLISRF